MYFVPTFWFCHHAWTLGMMISWALFITCLPVHQPFICNTSLRHISPSNTSSKVFTISTISPLDPVDPGPTYHYDGQLLSELYKAATVATLRWNIFFRFFFNYVFFLHLRSLDCSPWCCDSGRGSRRTCPWRRRCRWWRSRSWWTGRWTLWTSGCRQSRTASDAFLKTKPSSAFLLSCEFKQIVKHLH